jgi:hypothetical protein
MEVYQNSPAESHLKLHTDTAWQLIIPLPNLLLRIVTLKQSQRHLRFISKVNTHRLCFSAAYEARPRLDVASPRISNQLVTEAVDWKQ